MGEGGFYWEFKKTMGDLGHETLAKRMEIEAASGKGFIFHKFSVRNSGASSGTSSGGRAFGHNIAKSGLGVQESRSVRQRN